MELIKIHKVKEIEIISEMLRRVSAQGAAWQEANSFPNYRED